MPRSSGKSRQTIRTPPNQAPRPDLRGRAAAIALATAAWASGAAAQLPSPFAAGGEKPLVVIEAPANVPAGAMKAVGSESVLFFLGSQPVAGAPGHRRVRFREEGTTPLYFAQNGGGSVAGTAEVDCASRAFQLQSLRVYARNNLTGGVIANSDTPTAWQLPDQTTVLGQVIQQTCGPRRALGQGGARITPPGPAAAPASASATATPKPPAPAAAPARPEPVAGGKYWVQIAANASYAVARSALADLASAEPGLVGGLAQDVSKAQVNGATVFRSLIGPFADRRTAAGLCTRLKARDHACFVQGG